KGGSDADRRGEKQDDESDHGGTGKPDRTTMAPDIFGLELVFGHAMYRRGKLGYGLSEARMPEVELSLVARPTKIEMPGFLLKPSEECGRQSRREWRVVVLARSGPNQQAVGNDRQDALRIPVLAPVLDLAIDPRRGSRLRRGHEQEPCRLVEGASDRSPQLRVYGQTRVVTKDPQCPAPVPRPGQALQTGLHCGCETPVGRVRIGDERVVGGTRSRHRMVAPSS